MNLSRRQALRGLLALPAAALAVKLGAPEYMGEEIKEELAADLIREPVSVGFSDVKVFDNRPIYQSTARLREFWAEQISKTLGVSKYDDGVRQATKQMSHEMDTRLEQMKVEDGAKVIMDIPYLRNVHTKYDGSKEFELVSSVTAKKGLFGTTEYRVGYTPPKDPRLLDANGVEFKKTEDPNAFMGPGIIQIVKDGAVRKLPERAALKMQR